MSVQREHAFDGDSYEPELDFERLSTLLERVHATMRDGQWHTLAGLVRNCGGSEASVSARLRDLRKARHGYHDIRKRRVEGHPGLFEYRMHSARPIGNVGLTWQPANRYAWLSTPEGFTVAHVAHPVPPVGSAQRSGIRWMYEAWDSREKPARCLGFRERLDDAQELADQEYLKGIDA